MSEVAIEMSKGNFDIRANENEDGEIGLLARALNTLCENISGTIYQLRMEKGQLDQILQSLSDGVAAIDGSGELTHYNAALMRMFGVVNVEKTEDLLDFLLPNFVDEGKSELVIAVGCTGGKHRSVCLAKEFADFITRRGYAVTLGHRDISRR